MIKCPNCGTLNPEGSQFCGECGTTLATQTSQTGPAEQVQPAPLLNTQPQDIARGGAQVYNVQPTTMPVPPQSNPNPYTTQTLNQPTPGTQPNVMYNPNPSPVAVPAETSSSNRTLLNIIAAILLALGGVLMVVGLLAFIGASSNPGEYGNPLGTSSVCYLPGVLLLGAAIFVFYYTNRRSST